MRNASWEKSRVLLGARENMYRGAVRTGAWEGLSAVKGGDD